MPSPRLPPPTGWLSDAGYFCALPCEPKSRTIHRAALGLQILNNESRRFDFDKACDNRACFVRVNFAEIAGEQDGSDVPGKLDTMLAHGDFKPFSEKRDEEKKSN
jgi:hypothetical protein